MPEVITRTITLFKFEELDERAKEKAREWYRSCIDSNDYDHVISNCVEAGEMLGIDFDTSPVKLVGGGIRHDPKIHYSGFHCQGDGASFRGTYRYKKGSVAAIKKEYTPPSGELSKNSAELIRIAEALQALQKRWFYKLFARMGNGPGSNHSSHSGTMSVDVEYKLDEYRDLGDAEEDLTQLMRDFADWIYYCLRDEDEYMNSDEVVDENIKANEYTFDEDGHREN